MIFKKLTCAFVAAAIFATAVPAVSAQEKISAHSAVLIDADTGDILFEKNSSERLGMASTTKIMTALLSLESEQVDEVFTIDSSALRVEGTSMGLCDGDRVTLRTLASGMLLLSGNDAATAAALRLSGSCEAFAKKMNDRAAIYKMENTHFVTPSGLDAQEHYSTALDMALLGAQAIKNPDFLDICDKARLTVCIDGSSSRRTFYNHNRLLRELDGCIGIKTGFTKKSGRCLVSAVRRGGRTLVCATLRAPNDWCDHKQLYSYGFSLYSEVLPSPLSHTLKIVGSELGSVTATAVFPSFLIRKNEVTGTYVLSRPFEYAPVFKGETVGRAVFTVNGTPLYTAPLIADVTIPAAKKEPEKKNVSLSQRLYRFFMRLLGLEKNNAP